ncbi:M23 family metallopeptidase [Pseudoclavibacter helvolus]
MHNGLDLGVNGGTCGAPLYAVHSGTITYAGYNGGFGNHVVLDFGNGTEVSYSHIMDGGINVYVGQTVNAGDVLAYAGTTGSSTGCHLHFELKYWGTLMDPKPWLASAGIYYY